LGDENAATDLRYIYMEAGHINKIFARKSHRFLGSVCGRFAVGRSVAIGLDGYHRVSNLSPLEVLNFHNPFVFPPKSISCRKKSGKIVETNLLLIFTSFKYSADHLQKIFCCFNASKIPGKYQRCRAAVI
jgi:hypothetical protein